MKSKHTVIIGAGISGLATAYFLRKKDPHQRITLIDRQAKAGGMVGSETLDGFLFERAARGFRPKGEEGIHTLQLIESLNLEHHLIQASSESKQRFLWWQGKLTPFPRSLWEVPTSPLLKGIKRTLIKEWFTAPSTKADESIYSFFSRHFSPEFAERFADPLTLGIYAGDIQNLSMRSCFPKFFAFDQAHGSLFQALLKSKRPTYTGRLKSYQKAPLLSFNRGMQVLMDALKKQTQALFLFDEEVCAIKQGENHQLLVMTNNRSLPADQVVMTTPLPIAAKVCQSLSLPPAPSLPFQSLSTLCVGFKSKVPLPEGFGFLIPSIEQEEALGCIWDSQVYPQQGKENETRLTFFVREPPADPTSKVQSFLSRYLGILRQPDMLHLYSWPKAIAQPPVDFVQHRDAWLLACKKQVPQLHFSGASLFGPAINQCVTQANTLTERLTQDVGGECHHDASPSSASHLAAY